MPQHEGISEKGPRHISCEGPRCRSDARGVHYRDCLQATFRNRAVAPLRLFIPASQLFHPPSLKCRSSRCEAILLIHNYPNKNRGFTIFTRRLVRINSGNLYPKFSSLSIPHALVCDTSAEHFKRITNSAYLGMRLATDPTPSFRTTPWPCKTGRGLAPLLTKFVWTSFCTVVL
jgi:hypothetical protein